MEHHGTVFLSLCVLYIDVILMYIVYNYYIVYLNLHDILTAYPSYINFVRTPIATTKPSQREGRDLRVVSRHHGNLCNTGLDLTVSTFTNTWKKSR